jgi:hypothetical protein
MGHSEFEQCCVFAERLQAGHGWLIVDSPSSRVEFLLVGR